jgi:thioredoxin reductase (NADPH)
MDVEHHPDAEKYLIGANASHASLPLVVLKDGTPLADPELPVLANAIGLRQKPAQEMYDVLIIGAGPAGMAASVYGSCEGLKTLLIEKSNPGGQAGNSARIENYLGFPSGLSGGELTRRAIAQTLRFGTEMLTPQEVKQITLKDGYKIVAMHDETIIHTRTVVIATGVSYARLDLPGIESFSGAGVYYGSAAIEAHACRNSDVYIVGGGNSACQAAMHLCQFANSVNILIRRDALKQTAANYLVQYISQVPNIIIHPHTEVSAVQGTSTLESITLKNSNTGEEKTVPAKALFIYIGTRPGTAWLGDLLKKDEKGYILTGQELMQDKSFSSFWKLEREPYLSESSIPGIFASGDVRSGAVAGISSAVGEGALAIRFVRKYLQEM